MLFFLTYESGDSDFALLCGSSNTSTSSNNSNSSNSNRVDSAMR